MARTAAGLPSGIRITDFISLGVIAKTFPIDKVRHVLGETGKASRRQRDLPAHVVVYYVIALALYMEASCREVLRFLLEGLLWLEGCRKGFCGDQGATGKLNNKARVRTFIPLPAASAYYRSLTEPNDAMFRVFDCFSSCSRS